MNHRDVALAALRGERVQRIPFIARMELWYDYHRNGGTLPAPYQKATLWEMQRDLGIGIFGRGGEGLFYDLQVQGVEVTRRVDGERTVTRWQTPHGSLTACDVMASALQGAAWDPARVEYPFKSPKDYDALQYLIEHTRVVPTLERFARLAEEIGAAGLTLPATPHLPAHQLMINYMGYEAFYLQMHENPGRVEPLADALTAQFRQILALAAECPAGVVCVGSNYDETMTPTPVFDRYFAPLYREARELLSQRGQVLLIHGDGDMRTLLQKIVDCGIQAVEAVTPKPMTTIDIAEARRIWKDKVAMWGGVACVMLTDTFSEEQFDQHLEALFRAVAPGDRFILGFGDNVPTDALWSRILRVVEFWRENGQYPILV